MVASRTRGALSFVPVLFGLVAGLLAVDGASARADGPGVGAPWVVSVGDSYISGEAGRWAGNTNRSYHDVDALGAKAYDDNPGHTAELIPGCHRSLSAEVYIGNGASGENLACSGARTYSFTDKGQFKPGLDFYNSGAHEGQALMLEKFARSHNVTLVPLSIGGNNFKFSEIVQTCIEDFLVPFFKIHCYDKKPVTTEFSAVNVERQRQAIIGGIRNIDRAMLNDGYKSLQFTILVQDYPAPIPVATNIRYPETYKRQSVGGCGLWNIDADAANSRWLPVIDNTISGAAAASGVSNIRTMQLSNAFVGHRLCAKGVGLLEEEGLSSWKQVGAAEKSEWVSQARTITALLPLLFPYQLQEDLHPNYWGQLALRNCLRQAYVAATVRNGACSVGVGVDREGEPNMIFR